MHYINGIQTLIKKNKTVFLMAIECGKVGLCAKTLTYDGEKYGALLSADDKRPFRSPLHRNFLFGRPSEIRGRFHRAGR